MKRGFPFLRIASTVFRFIPYKSIYNIKSAIHAQENSHQKHFKEEHLENLYHDFESGLSTSVTTGTSSSVVECSPDVREAIGSNPGPNVTKHLKIIGTYGFLA